ncbi:pentatricopeptide repeat-containing protein At5g66520-like [Dendrobium catenatum]|uniref:Pentatricopeptide repeat-containing protein n=1 Tax=Dendrobium catenatum TaxID=906689 RepID=A0A2I0WSY0_9ASPA|nr:pentatricopeptide repeat-containing protein At5g66520-like [Dendrobium catenatum]XP_028550931.1 pentatricopeptide repeat-containing protein At5g66520-like [Dendrobium catenatum]PKU78764.1 Pentatricopeptide repeat-containing protein [Dendrobium catenatum]
MVVPPHFSSKPPKPLFSSSKAAVTTSSAARRILDYLSTLTSSSSLPSLLFDILRDGLHVNSAVSAAFISCSLSLLSPRPAILLFSVLRRPSPFVCNTLMRSLLAFRSSAPLFIFHQMHLSSVPSNHHTFPLILKSLSILRFLHSGFSLHSHILKLGHLSDSYISSSLLHFYAVCSDSDTAVHLFDDLPLRGVVAWSTLIAGLAKADRPEDALLVFERMHFAGVTPNRVTMVSTLAACAAHGASLDFGQWIHRQATHAGWELDVVLGTALVDMYCKYGCVNAGFDVFLRMPQRSLFTWNSLIQGFAFSKGGAMALKWFLRMEEEGVRPDAVTLVGVLTACSHSGLVEPGRRIFDMVVGGKFGFKAGIKHYGCMVDLYGKAGLLDAAVECIQMMPFEPNVVIYGSLLSGSRARKEMHLSEFAVRRLVELQPENAAHYVLLSNLYVEMGMWKEAEEVRRSMRELDLRKESGWSLTEWDDMEEYFEEAV